VAPGVRVMIAIHSCAMRFLPPAPCGSLHLAMDRKAVRSLHPSGAWLELTGGFVAWAWEACCSPTIEAGALPDSQSPMVADGER
jgi:hypothetical protein